VIAAILLAIAATGTDGFTILDADSGDVVHHCEVLGGDTYKEVTYQAVVCVNIITGPTSDGYYATGQAEAYCQTSGGLTDPEKTVLFLPPSTVPVASEPPSPTAVTLLP